MKTRLEAFDGLRGVAALVVVVHHFLLAFAPHVGPEFSSAPPAWVDSPLGIVINGGFAVSVFFALSGFVLALTSQKPRVKLPRDLVARYCAWPCPPPPVCSSLAWL